MNVNKLYSLLWIVAGFSLLAAILTYIQVGASTRYVADDYCIAQVAMSKGLFGAQSHWYNAWSGRYSYTFFATAATLIGPGVAPILPGLTLAVWLLGISWAAKQVLPDLQNRWIGLTLAGLLIVATLESLPNIFQSLYWQTGILTYTWPLMGMILYIGFAGRLGKSGKGQEYTWLLLSFAITFILGGFSSSYVAFQTVGLSVAIIFLRTKRQPANLGGFLTAGLIGSLLSMLVIFLAPGNEFRQASFPPPPGLIEVGWLSLVFAAKFVGKALIFTPFSSLLSLIVPAIFVINNSPEESAAPMVLRSELVKIISAGSVVFLVISAAFAPAVYGTSTTLPPRAVIIPQFLFTVYLVFVGIRAGLLLRPFLISIEERQSFGRVINMFGMGLALVLLILVPIQASLVNYSKLDSLDQFAQAWDERDVEIRASSVADLEISLLPVENKGGLQALNSNPQSFMNVCAAKYYGLNTLIAVP